MKIISTVSELKQELNQARHANKTIGLVPTMGALHKGHLSLIKQSIQDTDFSVVSIFVNPTQFNQQKDYDTYPRTLEKDIESLASYQVDVVFTPTEKEIYPEEDKRTFDYPPFSTIMEGEKRPGHFNGVCQIVSKLFLYVQPDIAYFGEKDFQQIAVIRAMVKGLQIPLKIKACPIIREESGLALSSRNMLLTETERKIATNIYKTLQSSLVFAKAHTVDETIRYVTSQINAIPGLDIEYFKIIDVDRFSEITKWDEAKNIQGCITVYCGENNIRLIDNISYK